MTDQIEPTTILNGHTDVAVAGTQVTLGLGTSIRSVTIKANATNTDNIFVGSTTVSAANGYILEPGTSVSLALSLRSTVWIDAAVNGEGVSYIAVA